MLDKLQLDDFSKHRDETFRLAGPEGGPLEMKLVEAQATGGTAKDRQPFSLIFRGPAKPVLAQAIYPLEHSEMGTLDLFLVPIGPAAGGMDYEAVFT